MISATTSDRVLTIMILTCLLLKGSKSSFVDRLLAIVSCREQQERICVWGRDWKSELFVIVNSGGLEVCVVEVGPIADESSFRGPWNEKSDRACGNNVSRSIERGISSTPIVAGCCCC